MICPEFCVMLRYIPRQVRITLLHIHRMAAVRKTMAQLRLTTVNCEPHIHLENIVSTTPAVVFLFWSWRSPQCRACSPTGQIDTRVVMVSTWRASETQKLLFVCRRNQQPGAAWVCVETLERDNHSVSLYTCTVYALTCARNWCLHATGRRKPVIYNSMITCLDYSTASQMKF